MGWNNVLWQGFKTHHLPHRLCLPTRPQKGPHYCSWAFFVSSPLHTSIKKGEIFSTFFLTGTKSLYRRILKICWLPASCMEHTEQEVANSHKVLLHKRRLWSNNQDTGLFAWFPAMTQSFSSWALRKSNSVTVVPSSPHMENTWDLDLVVYVKCVKLALSAVQEVILV